MAHQIKEYRGEYLAARTPNALQSWHKLESVCDSDVACFDFCVGELRHGVTRAGSVHPITGDFIPDESGYRPYAMFSNGEISISDQIVSPHWTPEKTERIMQRMLDIGQLFPLAFVSVLHDGFTIAASYELGEKTLPNGAKVKQYWAHIADNSGFRSARDTSTSINVVCANTLAMSEKTYNATFRHRHNYTIDDSRDEFIARGNDVMAGANKMFALYERMHMTAIPAGITLASVFEAYAPKPDVAGSGLTQWTNTLGALSIAQAETINLFGSDVMGSWGGILETATHYQKGARARGKGANRQSLNAGMAALGENHKFVEHIISLFERHNNTLQLA